MNRTSVISAIVSASLLLLSSVVAPAMASPFTGGTNGLTILGQPSVSVLNGNPTAKANYQNTNNVTLTLGLIFIVLHNSVGQTVYVQVATISNLAPNANSTAYVVIYGVQSGTYTATVFAELPSGTSMSVPTSVSITL